MGDIRERLTPEAQAFVCQCLAEYMSYQESADALKEAHGADVTIQAIAYYAHSADWQPLIDQLRAAWTARLVDLPAANKRTRIDMLWRIVNAKATRASDKRACLEAIRRELEGPDKPGTATDIHVHLGGQGETNKPADLPVDQPLVADPPSDTSDNGNP